MGLALLDSSAVIGYIDAGDALHVDAVEAIEATVRSGTSLALSVISWSELLHGAVLGHHPEDAVRDFVEDFGVEVLGANLDTAEHAAALQDAYHKTSKRGESRKLRTPDALILATYRQYASVDSIICGDGKWSKVPGINPADLTMLKG